MSTHLGMAGMAMGVALALLACGAPTPEPVTPTSAATPLATDNAPPTDEPAHEATPATLSLYRARCGQCHVRVEPKTRERPVLTAALERHKKRAKLSPSDVRDLVDYLAK